jgi:hypothetical protein
MIAYLFASKPGVSKVGSYTGTGAVQKIECGFRPSVVLYKRADAVGDWVLFDTSRDPSSPHTIYSRPGLNSGETTDADGLAVDASGFSLPAALNGNILGGSYLFLAVR